MAGTERIHAYLPRARRIALSTRRRFPRLIERDEAIAIAYLAVARISQIRTAAIRMAREHFSEEVQHG